MKVRALKKSDSLLKESGFFHKKWYNKEGLGIAVLRFAFRTDMLQFPSIMAGIVMLILEYLAGRVVILADIFFVGTGLSFRGPGA